jgi:NADPH:quinone reductase-like Zn-dependent oxidoreductase
MTTTMRAAVIRSHGQPPGYQDHPVPRRGRGQALIRVTAAPVCPLDLLCASGRSYFGKPPLPYAPGAQGVGSSGKPAPCRRASGPGSAATPG